MSDDNHKLQELTAYVYGEGTAAERAAFELHLRECPECRADVERLQRLLPYAHAQLRKPPDTSVDGMMRIMERAERELQATRAEKDASRARRRPWILVGATLAVAAAVVAAVLLIHPTAQLRDVVYGPPPPGVDGG